MPHFALLAINHIFDRQQAFGFAVEFPDSLHYRGSTWSYSKRLGQLFVSIDEPFPLQILTSEVW